MKKLGERLETIAEYINEGETVVDVGTDHGYLPLYLLQKNISPKVILSDINKGPLDIAKKNLAEESLNINEERYDLRLGNGLEVIEETEVDVAVIAGMGGLLIAEILAQNPQKTRSLKKIIIQPRTASNDLRRWLDTNGYYIYGEDIVQEYDKLCEIIAVDPTSTEKNEYNTDLDYTISRLLMEKKSELLIRRIDGLISESRAIVENIGTALNEDSNKRKIFHEDRMDELERRKSCLLKQQN